MKKLFLSFLYLSFSGTFSMNHDAQEAKKLYNEQAHTFSKNQLLYAPVQKLKQNIYAYLGDLKNKKILFVGCADGHECSRALELGAQVTGIDVSDKLIDAAKEHYPEAQFFVMDQAELTFSDKSFDIVISMFTVMYTEDLKKLFKEFRRVLKKDGTIMIAAPHPIRKMMKYNNMNYFVKGKQYENWKGVSRYNYYRLIEDYVEATNEAGLTMLKLMEPKPIKENENETDEHISYPHFLVLVLKKDKA